MNINKNDTAALSTLDPQNDVLSETGVPWELVKDSVKDNQTIENIEQIFKVAKQKEFEVFNFTSLLLSHRLWLELCRNRRANDVGVQRVRPQRCIEP